MSECVYSKEFNTCCYGNQLHWRCLFVRNATMSFYQALALCCCATYSYFNFKIPRKVKWKLTVLQFRKKKTFSCNIVHVFNFGFLLKCSRSSDRDPPRDVSLALSWRTLPKSWWGTLMCESRWRFQTSRLGAPSLKVTETRMLLFYGAHFVMINFAARLHYTEVKMFQDP